MPTLITTGAMSARAFGFGAGVQAFVLDLLSTPSVGAYGLRRLRTGYSGKAINIRRSSDNTTTDIGFLANGQFDSASALTFAGSGNAFVTTAYDQSGNGVNLTQSTAANQPQIITAGAFTATVGGQPALSFNGTSQFLSAASAPAVLTGDVKRMSSSVVQFTTTSKVSSVFEIGPFNATGTSWSVFLNNPALLSTFYAADLQLSANPGTSPVVASDGYDQTNHYGRFNGSPLSVAQTGLNLSNTGFYIGAAAGTYFLQGNWTETILFAGWNSTDIVILYRNQGAYYGVTVS